jgi:hypothetical protein
MSEHISPLQMRHFGERTLPVPEMSILAEHLATCGPCRRQFQQARWVRRTGAPLTFTLAPEAWLKHEHLQYEQLAPYLDGDLGSEEREILELHLSACASCREDVRSLREFRQQIAPEMNVSYAPVEQTTTRKKVHLGAGWFGWQWKPAYAVAAVVALIAVALVATISLSGRRADEQRAQVLRPTVKKKVANPESGPVSTSQTVANDNAVTDENVQTASNTSINKTHEAVKPPRTPMLSPERRVIVSPSDSSPTLAELNDGDRRITVDSAGNVTGLNDLTPASLQVVKETLLAQDITRPADLTELVGERGALHGDPAAGQSFKLLSPARAVIGSDRPTFKWEVMPGATSYRVYVGDADSREVANSGELSPSVTEWTPSASLPRGKVYTWAVIAKVNGNDVIAPAASQPEMRFKVLSGETLRDLTALQKRTRSHLALGVFYARAGMLEDAEREFHALARQNPRSQVAMKLLRSIQSWR